MPLRVGLTYTQMKLGRAYEHLDNLKGQVARFMRNNPYTERRYDYPQNNWHILCVEQHITPDPIGMLIGEFAYALRSGLDNLAWQLALLTTDKPNRKTAFPIESIYPVPNIKSFNEKVADIPPDALKVIESLQPYTNGPAFKDHALWKINKLSNLDKHQVVPISSINFELRVDGVSKTFGRRDDEIKHTIEIAVPLDEKDQVQFYVNCTGIVFGEPIETTDDVVDFEITLDGLRAIYDFVRNDAIQKFAQFFQ